MTGAVRSEPRAPGGVEIGASAVQSIAAPVEALPFTLGKKELGLALETDLEWRPLALRHPEHFHRFKIQAGILSGFREYLTKAGFTEICTPKLVAGNAEGGSNVFTLPYFGASASLAQSPQLYKQMMVGAFGRVFETSHVYRAEQHNTARHLNEYVSLDLEMGFIRNFGEIMAMETACLKHVLERLKTEYAESLAAFPRKLPEITTVPVLHLEEALEMLGEPSGPGSLSNEQEKKLCELVEQRFGSEFVFVTHYHAEERPFYAKEDPERPGETLSFDLLFRGIEITTGGQRIHEYEELLAKMKRRRMEPEPFRHYLMAFQFGLPPHGGLGLGLERLTARLTGEENVRQGSLFPRDIGRLAP